MGLFDRQILAVLTESKSKESRQILREAGFSHNTSQSHLTSLECHGVVDELRRLRMLLE